MVVRTTGIEITDRNTLDNLAQRQDSDNHVLWKIRPADQPIDLQRIEHAVREILIAIGEDPDRDGLLETPTRVARAYRDLFAGLRQDPAEYLARTFEQPTRDLVLVRDIQFASVCEHHLLPFVGRAHVAYLPAGDRVVGLSKLARTVEVFAKRPQVQERLTAQVADAITEHLEPRGVLVMVEAEHTCMSMRGVAKPGSLTLTTAARGIYEQDPAARSEVLQFFKSSLS